MKKFKSLKLMLLGVLALGSMNAFAQEKATTVWRYTVSGDNATLVGFVADLKDKANVEIPDQVTDPANASKKYNVKYIAENALTGDLVSLKVGKNLVQFPAKLLQNKGKLTTLDLSSATSLGKDGTTFVDAIPADAFKGSNNITAIDLSKTQVKQIHNWFGTTYEYTYTPTGNWTQPEADTENNNFLISKGVTPKKAGDSKAGSAKFVDYAEINAYYKEKYARAVAYGDAVPFTKETANDYNTSTFAQKTTCKKAGDPVNYTAEECAAHNATLEGAMTGGQTLTEYTKTLFNTATGQSKVVGDVLTQADADKYNATLPGKITTTDQKKNPDDSPMVYTTATAYDYNYNLWYGKEGGEGLAVEFNAAIPAKKFTSEIAAWQFNVDNVIANDDVKYPGDVNPLSGGKYTEAEARAQNESEVVKQGGTVVKAGTPKPAVPTTVKEVKNTKLESVKLNSIWTTIDANSFQACEGLTSIDFGKAAKKLSEQSQTVGNKAFLGTHITEFNFVGTNITEVPSDFFVVQGDKKAPSTNATLTTVTFNKYTKRVNAHAFQNCTALATIAFEARDIKTESAPGQPVVFEPECEFLGIGESAFENTAIAEIEIPQALDASKATNQFAVAQKAFSGCTNLKSFTYMVDNETADIYRVVDDMAFPGCKDVLYNTTNANVAGYMAAKKDAPKNTTFNIVSGDGYVTPFKAVKYANAEKWYIKYQAAADIMVKKDEAKVYNAYIDEGGDLTLNMCLYRASEGYYKIKKNERVLIITTNKDLTFETASFTTSGSMLGGLSNALEIVTAKEGVTRAVLDYKAGAKRSIYGWVNSAKAGTGFQKITTGDIFPQGTMYILAAEPKEAAARLNVRWLDENGNVEAETTGIESVINTEDADNEAIYNLQGIQVKGAQKGIFIQNGKKYVK